MNPLRLLARLGLASMAVAACSERPTVTAPNDLQPLAAAATANSGVNVLLKGPITDAVVADLSSIGPVLDRLPQINALTMRASAAELAAIRAKSYVAAAEMDVEVGDGPISMAAPADFSAGISAWDQDAIGATVSPTVSGRNPALQGYTGKGVYVLILDTGLLPTWPQYFPTERVAAQYAISFGGGGGEVGTVSSQPEKWGQDVNSHGTHVTSTILGYLFSDGAHVNGTAPAATVVPVKVLSQAGWGWSSVIARGILYAADLKAGPLAGSPVIVNMSLGGPRSLVEESAIDYAIAKGVIIVAAAGNEGTAGMSHPGAYAPVISVAAYGWARQWQACDGSGSIIRNWWRVCDVAEPTSAKDFFIADFSSREHAGQDLDVAAPGDWVVGPYQLNNGQLSYFFLGGTSMASPHVAGVAALMAEKDPSLRQADVERILEGTAIRMSAGSRTVFDDAGRYVKVSWGSDATGAGMVDAVAAVKAVGAKH